MTYRFTDPPGVHALHGARIEAKRSTGEEVYLHVYDGRFSWGDFLAVHEAHALVAQLQEALAADDEDAAGLGSDETASTSHV